MVNASVRRLVFAVSLQNTAGDGAEDDRDGYVAPQDNAKAVRRQYPLEVKTSEADHVDVRHHEL